MKKVLIFGHSSGLGLAVVKKLLENNISVAGFSRSSSGIMDDNLKEIKVDLSISNEVEKTIDIIKSDYNDFDAIIYCSGILTSHSPDEVDITEMKKLFEINFFSAVRIETELLKLIKRNEADVVNVTSSVVSEYYENYIEYNTSKVALQRFTSDLQKKLYGTKSRVIEFRPGGFRSNIYKNMLGDKINRNESEQMNPKDLADIIYFILNLPKKVNIKSIYIDKSF